MMKFHSFLCIVTIFSLNSCKDTFPKQDYRFRIKNNSNKDILYTESFQYPDTLVNTPNPLNDELNHLIIAGSEKVNRSSSSWEYIFSSISSDTLIVFIFEKRILENNDWEIVKKDYLILKRYDLSYEDLVNMDWTITYP